MSTQLTLGKIEFYPNPNRVTAIKTTFQPTISSTKESPKKTRQVLESTGQQMERQFRNFHAANPHVYSELLTMALLAKRTGKRLGIRLMYEKLRWEYAIRTTEDAPTLNNNYSSRYARLLMENEPELAGHFEVRSR